MFDMRKYIQLEKILSTAFCLKVALFMLFGQVQPSEENLHSISLHRFPLKKFYNIDNWSGG